MANNQFMRGARKTPRHKLLSCEPHIVMAVPDQFGVIPPKLSMKGNDRYGNCVSAEEAQAIAVYSLMCGLSQRFVTDQQCISWAQAHGVLNGADLTEVMDAMAKDAMPDDANDQNKDGPYKGVNYNDPATLNSATYTGPVKFALDADALPPGAGNQMGWYALQKGNFPNTDHCMHFSAYGRADYIYDLMKVPLPSAISPSTMGRAAYTWSTYGFVTDEWIAGTVVEAWVRNPTTLGLPSPAPGPSPSPGPSPTGNIAMPAFITDANGVKYPIGGNTLIVDMTKLPALIDAMCAFLVMPPLPPSFHAQWATRTAGMRPQAVNWTKLLQIGMLVFAWFSSGANPAGLPALITQIMAIITGP